MKVYELLADAVAREGVDVVFAVMGDGNMKFLADLESRHQTRIVYCRHEGSAIGMADGYARATGRPGVCSVTCGPGLTLLATSLVIASRGHSRVLVVAGDSPRGDVLYQQSIDQRRFVEACEAVAIELRSPETAAEDMQTSFTLVRGGRTTVFSAAFDVQDLQVPEGRSGYRPRSEIDVNGPLPLGPAPEQIEAAASMLRAARQPVIVGGRGALHARAELEQLADRTGAYLATSMLAKGLFEGHPRHVGVSGGLCTRQARAILTQADVVIGVGTSLSQYTTDKGRVFPDAAVIQIGLDPDELIHGRRMPGGLPAGPRRADCYVQADALLATRALLAAVPETWSESGFVSGSVAQIGAAPDLPVPPGTMHPREAMTRLSAAALASTLFVVGLGHFWWFPVTYLTGRDASAYQFTPEFGSIGMGFTSALGASVGATPRPVVLVDGDSSFMMSIQEIETAVRYGIDLVIVIMNDGGPGAEFHKLEAWGWDSSSAHMPSPDFARVAEAFGAHGVRVESGEELAGAVQKLQAAGGVGVIDARIAPNIVSDVYWESYFAGKKVGLR
jgi:acetolactate synthase I/II/III large subunit